MKKSILLLTVFSLFFGIGTTNAQILNDAKTMSLIKENIDCIYDFQFNKAEETYKKIQKSYPGHPVLNLLRGLQTYWQNYPIIAKTPAFKSFEKDMRECIQLSEKNNNSSYEAEYILHILCAKGMLLKFYDDNHMTMDVISLLTTSYSYYIDSFKLTNECADLQYYTGVYDYYREAYPKAYPIYKALVFLFPRGDMKKGLKELNFAAKNAVVLSAESYFILNFIYTNFENDYLTAIKYSKTLYEIYPNNLSYQVTYIKNLLFIKQYDVAEKLINASMEETKNKYFKSQLIILKGILYEKKYQNNNLAKNYYNTGISRISSFGTYGNEYAAYAYFGLSRISNLNNDTKTGKKYRDKALDMTSFEKNNFDQ